jgi:hypothetical protein
MTVVGLRAAPGRRGAVAWGLGAGVGLGAAPGWPGADGGSMTVVGLRAAPGRRGCGRLCLGVRLGDVIVGRSGAGVITLTGGSGAGAGPVGFVGPAR